MNYIVHNHSFTMATSDKMKNYGSNNAEKHGSGLLLDCQSFISAEGLKPNASPAKRTFHS